MKNEYKAPAIEVLRVEDTEVCDGVNWFNGVPGHKNCGYNSISKKWTNLDECTHS